MLLQYCKSKYILSLIGIVNYVKDTEVLFCAASISTSKTQRILIRTETFVISLFFSMQCEIFKRKINIKIDCKVTCNRFSKRKDCHGKLEK